MTEPHPNESTSRDAQRHTLAELIRLATECVSLDPSLQKSLDQTIEQARKALANESHRLAGDVEAKIESENANFAQSMGRIDRERADLIRAMNDKSATQHQRLLGEYDNATNKVKKEYQDARWLADSVMDSAILHANTEHKSIVEKSESDRVELENVRADGIKRLQSLGYQSLGLIEHDEVKSNVSSSDFDAMKQAAMDDVQTLRTMTLPRWFVGATPLIANVAVVIMHRAKKARPT